MGNFRRKQASAEKSALCRAVAFALTGESLCVDAETPVEILAALADVGWDADRIGAEHGRCREAGVAWPHRVPIDVLDDAGPARVGATVNAVRELLGAYRPVAVRRGGVPDAGDRRLLADVPPHHGHVG